MVFLVQIFPGARSCPIMQNVALFMGQSLRAFNPNTCRTPCCGRIPAISGKRATEEANQPPEETISRYTDAMRMTGADDGWTQVITRNGSESP